MTGRKSLWMAAAGLAGAAVAVRKARTPRPATDSADRWLAVTVNCAPQELQIDKLPTPLQELGEDIETRISAAPADRGTELAVRFKEPPSDLARSVPARLAGQDPRQDLRRALREAKSLLETGEVLVPDEPTTHDTPGGKVVGLLSRRAGGEGVL
ncbi:hypothetical protein [Streptomyces griseorubiginosus]|uniref:hypothetical protein n=1 Tax=Streptomyces griseorubiginosus TaxID=67304 RepID=UPI002E7FB507|nr:hypothetical protein [Streptomyces griseorubiginosus]WUB49539.1 hypothetical protein OHN19_41865 [Streptomyces griseorubiginosus]WUB58068.1 hypothetical protein OG942_41875 [Streptomyces griseorubiginosus]